MLMSYFDNYAANHQPYKGGPWCYEDGLIYRGLEVLHVCTGEDRRLDHLQRLIAPQMLEGPALLGYDTNEYNIDHILSRRALLYLHEVTGLQVIDQAQLEGNWPETSASAMFAYVFQHAMQLGIWAGPVDNLLEDVVSRSLREKPGGGWEMAEICHVAGLGMYEGRFRDGTASYYISETRVADDTKGVGPLMMAAAVAHDLAAAENVAFAGE